MDYEILTISVIVVPKGEPIFSEQATKIEIDDEASGEFIIVTQPCRTESGIAINPEEWPVIRAAIDDMVGRCRL